MTLYGYARVSVREPEDKNLDLQVERLVRSGCAMGNIRAEEATAPPRGGPINGRSFVSFQFLIVRSASPRRLNRSASLRTSVVIVTPGGCTVF